MFDFVRGICDVTGQEWAALDSMDTSYFICFYPESRCGIGCLVQVGKYQAIMRHDTSNGETYYYYHDTVPV